MPGVSDLTAMDFARPEDREGKTQLGKARSGMVSAEMKRVATARAASVAGADLRRSGRGADDRSGQQGAFEI